MIFPALGTKETKLYWDIQIEQKVIFEAKKKNSMAYSLHRSEGKLYNSDYF